MKDVEFGVKWPAVPWLGSLRRTQEQCFNSLENVLNLQGFNPVLAQKNDIYQFMSSKCVGVW